MATIYRILVEQSTRATKEDGRKGGNRLGTSKKTTAKTHNLFGGSRGGVEHNRKMRAINPVLNKATSGYWEKGMRLGRAGLGLVKFDEQTGAFAGLSGTAIAIIIAFVLQTLMKWQQKERQKALELNAQNFKQLENGIGAIHSSYEINVDFWTGRQTYNQNK